MVAEATQGTVPVLIETIGRTAAANSVEVRARVNGVIEERPFVEGTDVKKGDALFVIDQRPLQAALKQYQANLAESEASSVFADKEVERYRPLVAEKVITPDHMESVLAKAEAARAAVNARNAAVETASLKLEFTTVVAPIDGRVGRAIRDVGNLVTAQETLLTSIAQLDPIYVYFELSEVDFLTLQAHQGATPLPVQMRFADKAVYSHDGKLDFIDLSVDFTTGTIAVRAVFPNPDQKVRPGQFAEVTVQLAEQPDQIMIPVEALTGGQAGDSVLVVGKGNTVESRSVTSGRVYNGMRVIDHGLAVGERVIVDGGQKARPGSVVKPQLVAAEKDAANNTPSAAVN